MLRFSRSGTPFHAYDDSRFPGKILPDLHTDQLDQPTTEHAYDSRLFTRSDLTWIVLVSVLLSLPFLNKAFHIDDPVVLQCAKRILINPLDPLGGEFDWFGVVLPFWQVTTNPPLLSYYLAPLVSIFGESETILHLAMMPFLAGILAGCLVLSRRFCRRLHWFPVLMIATSSAVVVSSNVMRDIPALSLICVGLAAGIRGLDTGRSGLLWLGSLLLGLAAVTKYSAGLAVAILLLYAFMSRRKLTVLPLLPSILPLGIWCGWTWLVYGEAHPWFLLLGKHSSGSFSTASKFFSLLVTLGSACLLAPLLAWRIQQDTRRARHLVLGGSLLLGLTAWWYHDGGASYQYMVWTVVGSFTLLGLLAVGLGPGGRAPDRDSAFLLLWALVVFSFSVSLVPFQAVRHVLGGLVPAALLCFRTRHPISVTARKGLQLLVGLQLLLALSVAWSDMEYANAYRDFARDVGRRHPEKEIWFLGQWGWHFYAKQAGFRQMHGYGEVPGSGSLVVWPKRVFVGRVSVENRDFLERLQLLETRDVHSSLPIQTMSFPEASFYSVVRRTVPFVFSRGPIETLRVYSAP